MFERHPRAIDVIKKQAQDFLHTRATAFISLTADNSTKQAGPVERAARNADFVNQLLTSGQSVSEYFERTGKRVRFTPLIRGLIDGRTSMVVIADHLEYFKWSDVLADKYEDINYPVDRDILLYQWNKNQDRWLIRYFGSLSSEQIIKKIASEIR